ncbi:MAG TPA: alpha-glucan family phosphorylase [Acidimicrobiales bacterium]|nr:alpha-glucan family phosphorylase [Acidimicrobiales bacterium]
MSNRTTRADLERSLLELARNYRWAWDRATHTLLERVRTIADAPPGHPMAIVPLLDDSDWSAIVADQDLVNTINEVHVDLQRCLQAVKGPRSIAYFSPEFGISEALPQYSGGLGILAGDHLKASSDLGVPLVGVGLFYREGFFRQLVTDGRQHEWYQQQEASILGLGDTGIRVPIELGDHTAWVRVWRCEVGATPLFMLDTDLPENSARDRAITDRLYSGDQEHRLRQELVLGVGGARALTALGIAPRCYHLNEGHAGLLILELLGGYLEQGLSFNNAIAAVRPLTLFTTHTPVPAGIDRFPRDLFTRYVGAWCDRHRVSMDELFPLGVLPGDGHDPPFNMAAFCLTIAGRANGVSQLHGEVSRRMFHDLPHGPSIGAVTNGVHSRTWVNPTLQDAFDRVLGPSWAEGDPSAWARVDELDDDELRDVFADGRRQLVDMVVARAATSAKLDPAALTIGFARRFATYKRASLMLLEVDRVIKLLSDDDRPIQFVFAGKAHPADEPGKALLAQVNEFATYTAARGRFVFIPDYDIDVARMLYRGCDVWLNNPVRPQEACGTSGMKAALNGSLNCSIRDGWWDELFDGQNGWSIPTSDETDAAARDFEEASSLLTIVESRIVPLYYGDGGIPSTGWMAKVRHAWKTMGAQLTAARMVREYRDRYYS